MPDHIEEEMEIMEERAHEEEHHEISSALDIEDPIKKLNLRPVIKANHNQTIKEVVKILNEQHMGCVLVADDQDRTVGIFTERDILKRILQNNLDLNKEKLKDHMTKNPETLSEDDPIAYALNKMSAGSYRHIPITKKGEVKYILSVKDIVDHISMTYRPKVLNIPPDPNQTITQYGE